MSDTRPTHSVYAAYDRDDASPLESVVARQASVGGIEFRVRPSHPLSSEWTAEVCGLPAEMEAHGTGYSPSDALRAAQEALAQLALQIVFPRK